MNKSTRIWKVIVLLATVLSLAGWTIKGSLHMTVAQAHPSPCLRPNDAVAANSGALIAFTTPPTDNDDGNMYFYNTITSAIEQVPMAIHARYPSWSWDGQNLAYHYHDQLYALIPFTAGQPQLISPYGGPSAWSPDGNKIAHYWRGNI